MAVYPSRFTGNQIDDVIGLFNQKGLNNVVGIIQKNQDGTFSIADLSWAADKSETVSAISYDSINKKIVQSIDGVDSDVVSVATLMDDFGVGEANGIVPLNSSSKIDSIFLPSYVDDVLEFDGLSNFPETGETGKIYVDTVTNKTYRWSGSIYVEISPSSIVTVNRDLVSGIKSATITVDGSSYDLYAPVETDPVFSASPAAGISATDINNWNSKEIFIAEYNVTTFNQIKAAKEAGKYIVLKYEEDNTATMYLDLIQFIDALTDSSPYAEARFGLSVTGNVSGALISCACTVQQDPEDESQTIETWELYDLVIPSKQYVDNLVGNIETLLAAI